jgi:hypothetical protein
MFVRFRVKCLIYSWFTGVAELLYFVNLRSSGAKRGGRS